MPEFTYALGEVVNLDPTGKGRGRDGRVIGQVRWEDGSVGYFVAVVDIGTGGILRHMVNETELCIPQR